MEPFYGFPASALQKVITGPGFSWVIFWARNVEALKEAASKPHTFREVLLDAFYTLMLSHVLVPPQGCDNPPVVAHGHHTQVIALFGIKKDEVVYKCDEGYTLVGEDRLFCRSSRWSPAAPRCKGNSSSFFRAKWVELS